MMSCATLCMCHAVSCCAVLCVDSGSLPYIKCRAVCKQSANKRLKDVAEQQVSQVLTNVFECCKPSVTATNRLLSSSGAS